MHLYIIARGVKRYVERWREDVQNFMLPTDKAGETLQIVLRPVTLYEVIYPEGQHDKALEILEIGESENYGKKMKPLLDIIRRIMRLDKVKLPKRDDKTKVVYSHSRINVGVHVIGSKKDAYKEDKHEIL